MENIIKTTADKYRFVGRLSKMIMIAKHKNSMGQYSDRGQMRVLKILNMKPGISPREIGFLLDISRQSLSETLIKLEKQELIIRKQSESDKRAMDIELTEKGVQQANKKFESPLQKSINKLSNEEQNQLETILDKLSASLEEEVESIPENEFSQRRAKFKEFIKSLTPEQREEFFANKHKSKCK
jgi:DNA-binding MarR family transcriptional regulator